MHHNLDALIVVMNLSLTQVILMPQGEKEDVDDNPPLPYNILFK